MLIRSVFQIQSLFSCSLLAVLVFVATAVTTPTVNAQVQDRVVLTDYKDKAVDVGGENEDWQPAFQAALTAAVEQGRPLYVPTGKYVIRKAIEITHGGNPNHFLNPQKVQIIGAGPNHSIIQQVNEKENAINWSGSTYKTSLAGGSIRDIAIAGGDITLNIRWHNYFRMNNCYIAGAMTYGIYAEGWSSRFSDSIVRWCRGAGFRAGAHFNDIKIDGFYFSRNSRSIELIGGNGIFIRDSGFENSSATAIFIQNTSKVVVTECYFESNGHNRGPKILDTGKGYPSSIHVDGIPSSLVITNNIFRGGQGYNTATQINLVACEGAIIKGNLFSNCLVAIKLLEKSHTDQQVIGTLTGIKVADNTIETRDNVKKLREGVPGIFMAEDKLGLIDEAKKHGSVFEEAMLITRKNTFEGE